MQIEVFGIRFSWDDGKAASNFKKHGIRFEHAVRVFADGFAELVQDRIVDGEERWQVVGEVGGRLLLVVFAVEEFADAETIRIIGARALEPRERRRYEND